MNTQEIDLDVVARECYAAVVSDCCDAVGLRNQTLDPAIHPMVMAGSVLVGWARPVLSVAVESIPARPYGSEIDFIDSLGPGQVIMGRCETDAAFWGELFSTAARVRGARGAVLDGLIRDRTRIEQVEGFSVYARGSRPTDSLGRCSIAERDMPVVVGGVTVSPGDLVVADIDGAVVVPGEAAVEVTERALDKARTENSARALLLKGATLRDAWERFGVL